MRDSIKARSAQGYAMIRECNPISGETTGYYLYDGEQFIMYARYASWDEYNHDVLSFGNECAHFCEAFTTREGNQFIYWRDEEIDADYLTRVPEDM